MIGKILSHLLGNFADDFDEAGDARYEELMESEEGGWVIVNVSDGVPLSAPLVDPLEDLLIEHPSMSVYQRGREQGERRKTSRSALYRQNLAKTRFSPTDKRYGHLQQPCQRLNNNY
ncbi:hypothetical protein NHX12_006443 [Muraenolepis orangiensis]|uniref:Uncharacterized protein n=1 Tax=Muraenolepis orangiensis TaxID=630683 RepID=A0A9Q0DTC4_9TELE|nr:hypothetical protein NHX12_006443 [Muraenolepis orangiensis]